MAFIDVHDLTKEFTLRTPGFIRFYGRKSVLPPFHNFPFGSAWCSASAPNYGGMCPFPILSGCCGIFTASRRRLTGLGFGSLARPWAWRTLGTRLFGG